MDSGLGSKFGREDEGLDMSSPGLLDESLETKPLPNDTLYSILNVPTTASATEIRERYRELAVLLHPDKAPPEHKQAAETQFRNLQRAFEVLLDPERRAIYDALGEDGLRSEWRVGLKGKSPEQLRDDYATFVTQRSELLADRVFMPVSNTFTCEIDTSGTLRRYRYPREQETSVQVRRLALGSKYKTQLTNSTSATLSATLFQATADGKARIGRGLSGTIKHQFSPQLYFAASSSLLGARVVNLKAGYTVDSYTDAEIEGTSPLIIFAPTVKVSVNRRLHLNAVGSLSYFSGSSILQSPSSFTVSYARSASAPPSRTPLIASESHSHETTLELATNGGSVSTGYTIPLTRALTMQSGASKPLLTGELNLFLKADLRLARGLVFTCATFVGTGGLHLHLGIRRQRSRFNLPIILALPGEFNPLWGLGFALVPVVACWTAETRWLKPVRRAEQKSRIAEAREEISEELSRQKQEAQEVIALMREPVSRRVEAERRRDGLIIDWAVYGSAEVIDSLASPYSITTDDVNRSSSSGNQGGELIDVTVPLQALVHHSQLSIPQGRSKSGLVGFHDPCYGERKRLVVMYTFKGKAHRAVVDDEALLLLPLRGHAVARQE